MSNRALLAMVHGGLGFLEAGAGHVSKKYSRDRSAGLRPSFLRWFQASQGYRGALPFA